MDMAYLTNRLLSIATMAWEDRVACKIDALYAYFKSPSSTSKKTKLRQAISASSCDDVELVERWNSFAPRRHAPVQSPVGIKILWQ